MQLHTAEVGYSLMQFVLSFYTSFQVQGTGNSSFTFSISPYSLLWPFIRKPDQNAPLTISTINHITLPTTNYNTGQSITTVVWTSNLDLILRMTYAQDIETLASTNRPSQGSFHLNDHMLLKCLVQATACWKEVELPSRNSILPTEVSLILKSPIKFCNMYCNLSIEQ